MNGIIQNLMGMGGMTDQVIATDLLVSAKAGVRNYAFAITETATPELRAALKEQLFAAINTHAQVANYMVSKRYYHPNQLNEQLQMDLNTTDTALNLAKQ